MEQLVEGLSFSQKASCGRKYRLEFLAADPVEIGILGSFPSQNVF